MCGHKPKALFSHTHTETDRKKQLRCKKKQILYGVFNSRNKKENSVKEIEVREE